MGANAARTPEIFFMVLLLSLLRQEKTSGASRRSRNCFGTFLNGYSTRLPLCHERNNRTGDELQNRVGSVFPDRHKKVGPSSPQAGAVSLRGDTLMKLMHKFARMTPEQRPQDPHMDGADLRFETMEHGGGSPHSQPQGTKRTDAPASSCIY